MAETETKSLDQDQMAVMMPNAITLLSSLLQRVVEMNDLSLRIQPQKISTTFHGHIKPNISVRSYLERIFKYANCSPSCFVVAYVYLDRFVEKQPSFQINSFCVHRLLITSVLVSAKFMDDIYYNNAFYAKVGGISTAEMNMLEVDFLFSLGFQLNVTPTIFYTYCTFLQREMLLQSPLQFVEPALNMGTSQQQQLMVMNKLKFNPSCFNEDESSHQKQLAAV